MFLRSTSQLPIPTFYSREVVRQLTSFNKTESAEHEREACDTTERVQAPWFHTIAQCYATKALFALCTASRTGTRIGQQYRVLDPTGIFAGAQKDGENNPKTRRCLEF